MTDLEVMAEKADQLAAKFREPASFELVRACLNEAGVTAARRALTVALDNMAVAQEAKRDADAAERDAKANVEKLLVDADWALVPPDTNEAGAKLLAADKASWKKQEALKDPKVVAAAKHLRECEHATAVARDALTITDLRLKASRSDLDAAVATLGALTLALPARKEA